MIDRQFLNATQFAELAGVGERRARKALARGLEGKTWHGQSLVVRKIGSQGGSSGLRYEVLLDSLPTDMQAKWRQARGVSTDESANAPPSKVSAHSDWSWRLQIIRPALAHPAGSTGRTAAIRAIVAAEHVDSDGCLRRFSENTIREWLRRYEARGISGLNRKGRTDRGKARTAISREWDRSVDAAGLGLEDQTQIVGAVRRHVRSLWAGPATFAGWRRIAKLASGRLYDLTVAALGTEHPAATPGVCRVPREFVERERHYRVVGVHGRDRKAFDDHQRPRISRAVDHMRPMQQVIGDVHPADIYYTRADGSTATAKLIAWLDVANHRLRVLPVFLEKGEGVRQEHVIQSFIEMAGDPLWGMPSGLYLDNGSEYDWTGFVEDALKLTGMRIDFSGQTTDAGGSPVTRAQPYNAAAKGVLEGAFANLEQRFLSMVPGWVGGDRMRKKTAHLGKPPAPFPGSPAALAETIRDAVAAYNATEQRGRLVGRSPDQVFAAHVEDGWGRTDIAEADLLAAFCRKEVRVVSKGAISFDGRSYYDDALARLPAGSKVEIGIPKWPGAGRIAVWDARGTFLCAAAPDRPYAHDDRSGAVEAGRRRKVAQARVAELRRDIVPIDGVALLRGEAARAALALVPERAGVIRFDHNQTKAGKALAETPAARRKREAEAERSYRSEIAETLQKLVGAGGGSR